MGNSCHIKKKQPQIGSQQIFQITDQQLPKTKSNKKGQIIGQNNQASSIEQGKTSANRKNCPDDENQSIIIPNLQSVAQDEELYQFKSDVSQDEEDEVEEPQVLNKNDVVEQNLNVDLDARVGEIKERINLNITPRQETIQLTPMTQVLPVIVELQTFKNQTNHVKLKMDKMMIKGLMIEQLKDYINMLLKILLQLILLVLEQIMIQKL